MLIGGEWSAFTILSRLSLGRSSRLEMTADQLPPCFEHGVVQIWLAMALNDDVVDQETDVMDTMKLSKDRPGKDPSGSWAGRAVSGGKRR